MSLLCVQKEWAFDIYKILYYEIVLVCYKTTTSLVFGFLSMPRGPNEWRMRKTIDKSSFPPVVEQFM